MVDGNFFPFGLWIFRRSFIRNQVQKFFPCLLIFAKNAQHGARSRLAVDLLHSSHHHAHVTERNGSDLIHLKYAENSLLKDTHVASTTTPTPAGSIASVNAWAICLVNRS